jgi:hypothetical protein
MRQPCFDVVAALLAGCLPLSIWCDPSLLHPQIASVDCSNFAGGSGHVTVLATVDETAQLVGADGKRGEGYQTAYQVCRY